jgi:lysozyme
VTDRILRDPVSPECTTFAEEIRDDRNRFRVGYEEEREIDGRTIVAKVEWHTYKGRTGRRLDTPEPGVTLYERVPGMTTSPAGLEFIAKWEGEVLHVYKDTAGIDTIGIGHVVHPGETFPGGISHEQALSLLAVDIATAERAVNELGVELSQNAFDALVSFTFNVGTGALESSTLARKLREGFRDGAADEFLRWDKAGGKPSVGLHNRREAERALFLSTAPDTTEAGRILEIAKDVDAGQEGLGDGEEK